MNDQDQLKNWESLFDSLPIETEPRADHQQQLKAQLKDQLDNESDSTVDNLPCPQSNTKHIGSILMKYKIPHLATAASLLIAFSITFLSGGPQVLALDSVIAKIVNAKFARWDMVVKLDDNTELTTRVSITPERTRQDEEDGSYLIFDWSAGKAVAFFPVDKTAMEMDLDTGGMELQSFDMVKALQDTLKIELENGVENVEALGDREVGGQTLSGFKIGPDGQIAIWINPETQSPVQIEFATNVKGVGNVVLKNYECDVEFEKGFFSLELPKGYSSVVEAETTEESFLQALRASCEASGGKFPKGLDVESIFKVSTESVEVAIEKRDPSDQPTAEAIEEHLKVFDGFGFLDSLYDNEKADAHYAGANVKLGDKDRPIFWYRPTDSGDYRVIYGDLTVNTVSAAPEVEGAVRLTASE